MNEIIDRLLEAISLLETTQRSFAEIAEIDPSNFAKMLRGKQKITDKTIGKICQAHKLSAEWLKNGIGNMKLPEITNGNFFSPGGIYAEDSEVVVGDAVLKERLKNLGKDIQDLRAEKRSWESERKSLQKEIEGLRSKNEYLNSELTKAKDMLINLLMKEEK